jgi:hypothetical protein
MSQKLLETSETKTIDARKVAKVERTQQIVVVLLFSLIF